MTTPRGRADDAVEQHVKKFLAMKPGQSFFVANHNPDDLKFLRRPFEKAGAGVEMWFTACDEIYQQPGTRVRRTEGKYDEL